MSHPHWPILRWIVAAITFVPSLGLAHDSLLDTAELRQIGLERMWIGHVDVDVGRDTLKFMTLHVNNSRAVAYFEIYVGEQRAQVIATLDRDAFGNTLGYERAQQRAELLAGELEKKLAATLVNYDAPRAEFDAVAFGDDPEAVARRKQLLADAQKTVSVRKYVEPRMTLYALNSSNVLKAFDAETGAVRWTRQIGPRNQPVIGVAANDAMVAVVSGTRVYCIEADQGRVLWSKPCPSMPSAGPAVSHNYIFVPMINGALEAFPFATNGAGSRNFVSFGQGSTTPVVTGRTVSWGTQHGVYNIAFFNNIGLMRARVRTNGPIVASPAKMGRVLFIPSTDGYVYAVDEILGSIYWEFSAGCAISQSPLAIGDGVYFVTDDFRLFKVNARTGESAAGWPRFVPGIDRIVGANEEMLYVIDRAGMLQARRHDTGSLVASMLSGDLLPILNSQTDRMFLASDDGTIQCVRPVGGEHPQFFIPVSEGVSGGTIKAKRLVPGQPTESETANARAADPFATSDQRAVPTEAAEDPFTASEYIYDNPFVTESTGDVNPFEVDSGSKPPTTGNDTGTKSPPPGQPAKPADDADPFGG